MRADARRNREAVLAAARHLIAEHGAGVGMDDIARHAGVAVGTLYGHFPSKASLVAAAVGDSVRELAELTEAAVASVRAGADAAGAFGACFRAAAARHGADRALKGAATGLGLAVPDISAADPCAWSDGAVAAEAVRPDAGAADAGEAPTATTRALTAMDQLLQAAVGAGAVRPDIEVTDLAVLLDGVPTAPGVHAERYVDVVLRGLRPS